MNGNVRWLQIGVTALGLAAGVGKIYADFAVLKRDTAALEERVDRLEAERARLWEVKSWIERARGEPSE